MRTTREWAGIKVCKSQCVQVSLARRAGLERLARRARETQWALVGRFGEELYVATPPAPAPAVSPHSRVGRHLGARVFLDSNFRKQFRHEPLSFSRATLKCIERELLVVYIIQK